MVDLSILLNLSHMTYISINIFCITHIWHISLNKIFLKVCLMLSFFFPISSFNFIINFSFSKTWTGDFVCKYTRWRYFFQVYQSGKDFPTIPSVGFGACDCQCLPIMEFYHANCRDFLVLQLRASSVKEGVLFFSFTAGPLCPAWCQVPSKYSRCVWVCVRMHVHSTNWL